MFDLGMKHMEDHQGKTLDDVVELGIEIAERGQDAAAK